MNKLGFRQVWREDDLFLVLRPSCAYVGGPIGAQPSMWGPLLKAKKGSLDFRRIEDGLGPCVEGDVTRRMLPVQLAPLPCSGVRMCMAELLREGPEASAVSK